MTVNRQIRLARRPQGRATLEDFELTTVEVPKLADGQVLVRHHYLSLDPYMRGRMNATRNYAPSQPLGEVFQGRTAGDVIASRCADWPVGTWVTNDGGWQEYSVVDIGHGGALRQVDVQRVPLSYYLGAVGMPGATAWYGLTQILQPEAGATLTISAATGAVGSAFAALARARGCRIVGIAGGAEKCRYATAALGYDACIDHRQHTDVASMSAALASACPDGIDGHFINVGGHILDAVLQNLRAFARLALCGMIAGYQGEPLPIRNPRLLLINRVRLQAFIISEQPQAWAPALAELGDLVVQGKLRPRETIVQGIEAAPAAFLGLFEGRNIGKLLVKLT